MAGKTDKQDETLDVLKMTDEEFDKLNPTDFEGDMPNIIGDDTAEDPVEGAEEDPVKGKEGSEDGEADPDNDAEDAEGSEEDPDKESEDEDSEGEEEGEEDPDAEGEEGDEEEDPEDASGEDGEEGEEEAEEEPEKKVTDTSTPGKAGYIKLPEGMDKDAVNAAIAFHKKVTASFKANGRDLEVRSPEDAVRLMQQGAGFHKKMMNMRPAQQAAHKLKAHGLDDDTKLAFALDLLKGNKGAITELIKTHKIDPIDLDIEKDSGYKVTNYSANVQEIAFQDALDDTKNTSEGQELLVDIRDNWDDVSQNNLREHPETLGNMLELKRSGIYDKVAKELNYQRSLGYMNHKPYLQAFDEVGKEMAKQGVFDADEEVGPDTGTGMAPLGTATQKKSPISPGTRKPVKKKAGAPKNVSSKPVSKKGNSTKGNPHGPNVDYSKMSDEDFDKLPEPVW